MSESVSYRRDDLEAIIPKYQLIRDCIEGEASVKLQTTNYLPQPNADDTSIDNLSRYNSYLVRAVFYGVTGRTLRGLVGQIFLRDPVYDVPDLLQPVIADANGEGLDIIQLAKRLCTNVMAYGRCGLMVDYPKTLKPTTRQQLLDGEVAPMIKVFDPWNVINWRTVIKGSKKLLSLVVIKEKYEVNDDGFQKLLIDQWRVLRLLPTGCVVEIWRQGTDGTFSIKERYSLCDHKGKELHEIPFKFVGSENNDAEIDNPPMYDMAILNIAHYRNSADYEESCFITGQPTLFVNGLSQDWWENVLGKVIRMGARAAVPLPPESEANLLQSLPNTMPHEAMAHKERQMVAIGAKLIEQRNIERTATETEIESASDTSVLATAAKNASNMLLWALQKAASFAGIADTQLKFELNTNFDLASMTAEEMRQVMEAWQGHGITFSEMRENLKRSGIAKLSDEEAMAEIEKLKDMIPENQPPAQAKPDPKGDATDTPST